MDAFRNHHAHVCTPEEREKVLAAIFEDGHTARDVVGQSAQKIAQKAGITIPEGTKVFTKSSGGNDDPDTE